MSGIDEKRALVGIARSLVRIANLLQVAHGTCQDCGHGWAIHASEFSRGVCQGMAANGECRCTEPRPA